jgi:hypothetical protein
LALNLFQELMEEEKFEPIKPEVADIAGGYFDGKYMAVVHYKGEVFGIRESNEQQLFGSIKIAIKKRSEFDNDLRRNSNND